MLSVEQKMNERVQWMMLIKNDDYSGLLFVRLSTVMT